MCRRAQALALQRMLEEDFYFCVLYCYWEPDDFFYMAEAPRVFKNVPGLMYPAAIRFVRSIIRRDLYGQVCMYTVPYLYFRLL
jgi:hypothetical protein